MTISWTDVRLFGVKMKASARETMAKSHLAATGRIPESLVNGCWRLRAVTMKPIVKSPFMQA